MKKILLLILCCGMMTATAQIVITPNPVDINSGILTITYGTAGDFSLFDPMGTPNLLLYTGLDTDSDPLTWDYHDDIADVATMIPFNYDNTINAYIAQIDVAGRMYQEEPSLNMVNLPAGLMVNDWYFLIITPDLMRQSADLAGSDYGWQSGTLSQTDFTAASFNVIAVGDELLLNQSKTVAITIYDAAGRLIKEFKNEDASQRISLGFLNKSQLYVIQVNDDQQRVILKHIMR